MQLNSGQLTLEQLDRRAEENIQNAKASETHRAYRKHWRAFEAFCEAHQLNPLPAEPRDIVRFLNMLELEGKSAATVRGARAAISHQHREHGVAAAQNPARSPEVASTLQGINRRSPPQRQAAALLENDLEAIRRTATTPREKSRAGRPESPERARARGLMDIALCQTLRDAGLRCSEAAALRWRDVEDWPDGSGRITIPRSKTNKSGPPETVAITPRTLQALQDIRQEGQQPGDQVFNLSPRQITKRVKAAALAAGLGEGFSAHSGRVGLASNMSANGAPINATMKQGRWKRADTVARYTRNQSAGTALNWMG